MARWPGFIGPTYPVQSVAASSARAMNVYVEQREAPPGGTEPQFVYYGVPGLTTQTAAFAGEVKHRAAFFQDGRAFVVVGKVFFEVPAAGNPIAIGVVPDDGLPASIVSNGQAGHQLFIVGGKQGFIFDLTSGAWTAIADPDFPNGRALMGTFHEGYFVVITPTTFQTSKLFDGLTWSGADTGTRQWSSDNLAACLSSGRVLWLMGSARTEGWANTGVGNPPFAPITGAVFDYGIAAPWTLVTFDNAAAWLAQNKDGDRLVMQTEQYGAKRISSHALEAALRACPTLTDFRAYPYQEEGHTFYILTSIANKLTWACDAAVPPPFAWTERGSWNGATGQFDAQRAVTHLAAFGSHWVGDGATGTLYKQALGLYDDNGQPIRRLRRLPYVRQETKRIFLSRVALDCETGVGLAVGQGSLPELMLRCSWNRGKTWGEDRRASLGAIGNFDAVPLWTRFGSGRIPTLELSQSDPVKTCWVDLYVETA